MSPLSPDRSMSPPSPDLMCPFLENLPSQAAPPGFEHCRGGVQWCAGSQPDINSSTSSNQPKVSPFAIEHIHTGAHIDFSRPSSDLCLIHVHIWGWCQNGNSWFLLLDCWPKNPFKLKCIIKICRKWNWVVCPVSQVPRPTDLTSIQCTAFNLQKNGLAVCGGGVVFDS